MQSDVAKWLDEHKDELVDCRIATIMTARSCRVWQGAHKRYTYTNFDGTAGSQASGSILALAAQYKPCAECPHFLSAQDAAKEYRDQRTNAKHNTPREELNDG